LNVRLLVTLVEPKHGRLVVLDGEVVGAAMVAGLDTDGTELDMDGLVVGVGELINGLKPPLLISVAPSGMVPPFSVKLAPAPDCGDAVPPDTCDDPEAQPDVGELPVGSPPPSKVPPDPVADPVPAPQLAPGIGLSPPGSISVAPSGIPAPFDPPDVPGTPSGDVVPIADVAIELWAWAASQMNKKAVTTANARNIGISCVSTPRMSCT
jgi:hypothetical protein